MRFDGVAMNWMPHLIELQLAVLVHPLQLVLKVLSGRSVVYVTSLIGIPVKLLSPTIVKSFVRFSFPA
jgi:hypothetical protein